MPSSKPQKPAYKIVKQGNDYHVFKNDSEDGTPTGRVASSFDEGQLIIAELEERASAKRQAHSVPPIKQKAPKEQDKPPAVDRAIQVEPPRRNRMADEKFSSSRTRATSSGIEKTGNSVPAKKQIEKTWQRLSPASLSADEKIQTKNSIIRSVSPENADKAKRLFHFLRELTLLRSKTVRTLDKYTAVLWLSDFPKSPGCFSLYSAPEEERSELLLQIEQPLLKKPPEPPEELSNWIDREQLNSSKNESPKLKEIIAFSDSAQREEGKSNIKYESIHDSSDIQARWNEYVEKCWVPWAEQNRKDVAVQEWYEQIYDIQQLTQKLAEEYELLLAVGLLSWTTPTGQKVCRHLLTAKASVNFDTHTGTLEICAPQEGTVFQSEQDMLEISERPANHHRRGLEEQLAAVNENPLGTREIDEYLQSWLRAASARGAYSNQFEPILITEEEPRVTFAPAIVLRKRTERNLVRLFEEIINNIEETGELPLGVERLVSIVDDSDFTPDDNINGKELVDTEIYFPLAANADQREIAEKLRHRQGILVQGPPGTGKSHTIANLVCHLLASGKRILVTSHTPRALSVLRDKFPEEMKALCVSVIGDDGTAARKALEESVSGITNKRNKFNRLQNQQLINDLRLKLDSLREGEAWILNAMRGIRESDTYQHPLKFGAYTGTTQAIAQKLATQHESCHWLSICPSEGDEPPISDEEALELLELFRALPKQRIQDLKRFMLEQEDLSSPEQFTEWIAQQRSFSERSGRIEELKLHPAFAASSKLDAQTREQLSQALGEFTNTLHRILNRREPWVKKAVTEIVSDRDRAWRRLLSVTKDALSQIGADNDWLLSCNVTGLDGRDTQLVKVQAKDLLTHLEQKGSLGLFWRFRPRPVQEAMYLIKNTRVDGRLADNPETLRKLIQWLEANATMDTLRTAWQGVAEFNTGSVVAQIAEIEDCCEPLEESLSMHEKMTHLRDSLRPIPGLVEPSWDDLEEVNRFEEVLVAGHVEERLQHINAELQALQTKLSVAASNPDAHEIMNEVLGAVDKRDCDLFHRGYKKLTDLQAGRQLVRRREEILLKTTGIASSLIAEIEASSSEGHWDERLISFTKAWNWARASEWLRNLSSPETQLQLSEQLATAQSEIKDTLSQLAAALAWGHTFERLSDEEHSYLVAWEMAMRRIGKGTGKYAEQHRRAAREHMEKCRPSIPAWIMPIHKVVESMKVGGRPFDVVIVDEASQSGPEALLLMYFAKQIVVVGDDKQISPDFIGLDKESVNALRERFLKDVPFSDALGTDHSFFDQAKIRYRGIIRLKEHFRCMPEIIQFSNNLCYSDDPLIPLRQYGAGRLSPVLQTRYVQGGYTDDDSNRPINKPEADAIIEQIRQCCADPAYAGKTFGVISLLNTSGQADYIERRFKTENILSKDEIEERKLRIGDAYVFQGDERDILFLSMVTAPPSDGKRVSVMAAPKDERRFNVAASRARDQAWLFHSVSLSDLNPKCNRYNLLSYYSNPQVATNEIGDTDVKSLKERLARSAHSSENPPKPFDSWFEVDVFLRIVARGYRVLPQYPLNGYHIDMVVEGMKGRLAVECDGDIWHGPDRYDEDSARQRDLERCGMQFWRVRGSAFYFDKEKALGSLWARLEQLKIYPTEV